MRLSNERDFRCWHETDMPVQSPHVRCRGTNGPGWEAARSLKVTRSGRWTFGRIFGLDGCKSYRELRLDPLRCPYQAEEPLRMNGSIHRERTASEPQDRSSSVAHSIEVPSEIIRKWQEIVNLLAEIMHVPSASIMRVDPPHIKVFVSSTSKGNPCEPGALDAGPYCETVMKTGQPLLVPDALENDAWKANPHVKLGMISYLGVPIGWPDGRIFGTICVRDNKRNEYSEAYLKLLLHFRDLLQADLKSFARLHGEIEEREARIRRLVDSNIIGIFVWDFEGRILEANDEFLRMVNYDREDLVSGRIRWADLTPPDWRDRNNARIEQQKSSGRFQPFEKEYTRKDGSRVPVLVGGATFEEGGNQGVAFVLDLTERKCAEDALRASEQKLQKIIDTIPAHVVRYRPDGAADFMNQTFSEFVGPGVGFDNLRSVVHPEDYPERSRDWDTHVAAAEPYDIEMRLRRADGVYRWHRSRRVPLRDANGAIVNWYGAGHDIDDQKRAEQALRRSEAHLAEAQRLSHTGASAYNATTILYWSEETYRIFGFDPRDGLPSREVVWQRIHPDDRNRVRAEVEDAQISSEFRVVLPDGTLKFIESIRQPVFSTNGELVEVVATHIDVTERKRAEEAYREAQLELAHANRVATMGQLTASITHEVNQPITAAVTYALAARRFLSADPPNFREVDDALSLIVKEGNRAGEVVERVRALIKKVPARKDAVAIDDAILEVIALTRAEAANNSVSVRTQFAEGMPRVQGDRVQLQQVMLNLIVNAIQAMSGSGEGARELQISIDAVPSEGGVRVGVGDTGPGLSPESLSRLFEPFYTTKPEGMGMGLSICRSIIEAHAGRLWATRCEPRGALFQFTIPAD
jgi:PAS domain S-box-containing protein